MADLPINYGDTWKVARDKINDSFNELSATVQAYRPHIEDWIRWIWTTNTGVKAEWDSIVMKVEDWYIWYKSESNSWTKIIAVADLKWPQWNPWVDGNWIASITTTKIWKTTTVTITETDWNVDTFEIQDWEDWTWWGWDVKWPLGATSGNIAVFDWSTGKIIKDWWPVPSYTASDFDVKDLADTTNLRTTWSWKQDAIADLNDIRTWAWKWATAVQPWDIGTAAAKDTWTSSWNVPVLDSNWKLATTILPWVALTDTFTVSTSSDLTSLSSAEQWDLAIVTTESKTYVLSADPYSTAANWKEIISPTGWVTSVNGQTWAVTVPVGDVVWPASSTDGHLALFDWATGKLIKDWWTIPTWVPAVWTNGQVLTVVSWVAAWANASGWSSTITVTLASANRSSKSITVSATWVTASNTVIVSPDPASINDYATNSVYCSAQGSGTLTFSCNTEPTVDIDVNVLIIN